MLTRRLQLVALVVGMADFPTRRKEPLIVAVLKLAQPTPALEGPCDKSRYPT